LLTIQNDLNKEMNKEIQFHRIHKMKVF
jgi:hypothetical protein